MSDKVILVTGGTGMIGRSIQKLVEEEKKTGGRKNERWIFVGSKDGDLCNVDETDKIFEKYKPTHVVHLAAIVGGIMYNITHNLDSLKGNMRINTNVLDACFKYNVEKVLSCMSTCILPDKTTYPIDETMVHNGPPHPSNFGFSYAKRMIDIYNKGYNEQYGRNYTAVAPCNVFGPHDNFDPINSHVISGLIRKMYDAKVRGDKTYPVFGTGNPRRQFLYSLDAAKLIMWALREYNSTDPLILSVDEDDEVSIAEAARAIKDAIGFTGELVYDTSKPDGQIKKTVSNKKLRSYLPNYKFTSFKQAVNETVTWYMENKDIAKN